MEPKKIRRLPLYIGGLFTVITGIFLFLCPEITSGVIGILLGIVLFVSGISEFTGDIISIRQKNDEGNAYKICSEIGLVYSLIIMVCGLFLILKHDSVLMVLPSVTGLFILSCGIVRLRQAMLMFKKKDSFSLAVTGLAVFLVISGIVLLTEAFSGTRDTIVFTGIALVISGLESCLLGSDK